MKRSRILSAALGVAVAGGGLVMVAPQAQAAPYYENCSAAKAAGVAPIRWDLNPDLYWTNLHLDGGNYRTADGIACGSWSNIAKPNPKPASVSGPSKPKPAPTTGNTSEWVQAPKGALYPNCDAVRAAGKDPLPEGARGYGEWLDRDNDGFGCDKNDPAWNEAPSKGKPAKDSSKDSDKSDKGDKVVSDRGVEAKTGVEGDPSMALALVSAAGLAGVALRKRH